MRKTIAATSLALSLGLVLAAQAQTSAPPVGGPAAKGNAPIKAPHTINDGSAKPGANSFTQNQARQHILNSGYTDVTGLTKGADGVWRGTATRNGASVPVAMDFKGNVSEAGGAAAGAGSSQDTSTGGLSTGGSSMGGTTTTTTTKDHGAMQDAGAGGMMHHHHNHMRRHHDRCANPGPNGAACSGEDTNGNGVSDREERAMKGGAHP